MPRPGEGPAGWVWADGAPRSAEYPRSFEEASLALRVQEAVGAEPGATSYEDLGVYQLLAEVAHADGIERFARTWLGPLLAYDENRNADLLRPCACTSIAVGVTRRRPGRSRSTAAR